LALGTRTPPRLNFERKANTHPHPLDTHTGLRPGVHQNTELLPLFLIMVAVVMASSLCAHVAAAAVRPVLRQQEQQTRRSPSGLGGSSISCLRGGSASAAARERGDESVRRQQRPASSRRSVAAAAAASGGGRDAEAAAEAATGMADVAETRGDGDEAAGESNLPFDYALAGTALMATFAFAFFAAAEPSSAGELVRLGGEGADGLGPHELWSVAGSEIPFWVNMVKYARFSISIMVGFAYMFGRPVVALLKKPQTAVLVIGGGFAGFKFVSFTLNTMLGMNDPDTLFYEMHY